MEDPGRRDFIKSTMLAGTALLAPISLSELVGQGRRASRGDKVHLGVIGPGSRGQYLMQLINTVKDEYGIEIVAICDVLPANLELAHKLAPRAKTFTDYRKLLEHKPLDGVIITTPLHEHARMTIDALEHGIHVFCEKALALTMEDTYAMVEAHRRTGKVLYIGHQRLFDPKFIKGIKMVHSGQLGQITQIRAFWHRNNNWRRPVPPERPDLERLINWRLYRAYSKGLLTELACHQLQVANWAKQDLPIDVRGTGSISFWRDGREVEDNVALVYTYADGTMLTYSSMIQNRRYGFESQILGNLGTLEPEANRVFSEHPVIPKPAGIAQLINNLERNVFGNIPIGSASWAPELAMTYRGVEIVPGNNTDGTLEQIIAFADMVRKGRAIPGLLEHAYYASVWSLLGQDAIDTGQVVTMPKQYII